MVGKEDYCLSKVKKAPPTLRIPVHLFPWRLDWKFHRFLCTRRERELNEFPTFFLPRCCSQTNKLISDQGVSLRPESEGWVAVSRQTETHGRKSSLGVENKWRRRPPSNGQYQSELGLDWHGQKKIAPWRKEEVRFKALPAFI